MGAAGLGVVGTLARKGWWEEFCVSNLSKPDAVVFGEGGKLMQPRLASERPSCTEGIWYFRAKQFHCKGKMKLCKGTAIGMGCFRLLTLPGSL